MQQLGQASTCRSTWLTETNKQGASMANLPYLIIFATRTLEFQWRIGSINTYTRRKEIKQEVPDNL